jgi:hypothetical protein
MVGKFISPNTARALYEKSQPKSEAINMYLYVYMDIQRHV